MSSFALCCDISYTVLCCALRCVSGIGLACLLREFDTILEFLMWSFMGFDTEWVYAGLVLCASLCSGHLV